MARVSFYRYMSHPLEIDQTHRQRRIQTTNPYAAGTWYTPTRYEDPAIAQIELALDRRPTHRVGPVPYGDMPTFNVALRRVDPANGQPGGGWEVRVSEPVWLFGCWHFDGDRWSL